MADREYLGSGRYTSRIVATGRSLVQNALLKPYARSQVEIEVHGAEQLKELDPPFIVVANHSSHLDTALIFETLPTRLSKQLSVGAAADHWFNNPIKASLPSMFFNAYPVERSGKSRNDAKAKEHRGLSGRLLDSGVPILIFPEGTRSRTGAIGAFNPGIAALSISRGAPVLPVAIVGAFAAWPSNEKKVRPGRPTVRLVYGRPMRPTPGEIATEFSERIRRVIVEMHESTALAYNLPTLDDYARTAALKELPRGRS